jgi:hypothetical protein
MKDQFEKIKNLYGQMHFEMEKRRMLNDHTKAGRALKMKMNKISFAMKMTFENMVLIRMLQHMDDKSLRPMLEEMSPLTFFEEYDISKLKSHQKLLHFYFREAFVNFYKKDGECLYKPRYNRHGEFVYAYEYVMDIADFVYHSVFPLEERHYWFKCLTDSASNANHCINTLTKIKTEWIPDLLRNHDIHAFENGLFVISHNKFYYYKKHANKPCVSNLTGNLTAIRYHDLPFDEKGMEAEMRAFKTLTYMSIQLSSVHSILDTQGFSMEERQWILALLGRLLVPLGKMDNWSVFPYFLGVAGTGKSTCLRLVASMLEARDVGYLNNALQRTFALEGIYDKLLYMALDIDEKFELDQTTFQSMVCGEEVAVTRKHKKPLTKVWAIHGGFAGNKLPPWTDNGGSLSRRLVIIEYLRVVTKSDPNLFQKCLEQRDRFLKVTISAYHDMTQKYGDRNIKDVLPAKFLQAEKTALKELNPLVTFISDCCEIDSEPEDKKTFVQPFKDFSRAYKDFCRQQNIKGKSLNYTTYSSAFAKFLARVVDPVAGQRDPFGQTGKYILGFRLKPSMLDHHDDN